MKSSLIGTCFESDVLVGDDEFGDVLTIRSHYVGML